MAFAAPTQQPSDNAPSGNPPLGSSASDPSAIRQAAKPRQAQQQYQRAQIETASPTRLVVLLYDGAIRFCSLALDAMKAGDLETQNTNLIKAQRIVAELMSSLDRKTGGEVAENLFQLYRFALDKLVNANLYDQRKPIEEVLTILRELRETWQEIDRMTTQGTGSAEASPAPAASVKQPPAPASKPGVGPPQAPPAAAAKPGRGAQVLAAQAAQQKSAMNAAPRPVSRLGDRDA